MRLNLKAARWIFVVLILLGLAFLGGYKVGRGNSSLSDLYPKVILSREVPQKDLNFSLFWKVWDTLSNSYFDKSKLIPAKMVYGAIQGMVEAVGDPYTIFLPPNDNKITQEDLNGNFEGVGIQIGFKGTQLVVVAPLPDTPAFKANVKAGDYIVGIKDEAKKVDQGTVGISLPEAVSLIRGVAGTKVTLLLVRDGEEKPFSVELKREKINVPSVILSYVGEKDKFAVLKLSKFGGETKGEWEKKVSEIKSKGTVEGIILDVRNNPGGYLQGAIDIASEFLNKNSVVAIEERAGGVKNNFQTSRTGVFTNNKVVVLINSGSASASEILAGALRDNRKIKLIGETSFGKGTIQEPMDFELGSGLHITIAKWLTPSSFWVNEKGLEPDIKIKDNPETLEDEQLQEAIKQISL